jgi:hypothetical protein
LHSQARSKRRTVTLTIRIEERVEQALKEEAATGKITANGLVSQVLTDYVDWERHAKKFGFARVTVEGLAQMFSLLDDETLAEMGRRIAELRWASMMPIWYKDITPDTVLKFVILWLENTKTAKIAFSKEERPQRIVGFHQLGMQGSIVLKNAIETMFQIAHKKVAVEIHENQFSFALD